MEFNPAIQSGIPNYNYNAPKTYSICSQKSFQKAPLEICQKVLISQLHNMVFSLKLLNQYLFHVVKIATKIVHVSVLEINLCRELKQSNPNPFFLNG
jgi:hypothetical protein